MKCHGVTGKDLHTHATRPWSREQPWGEEQTQGHARPARFLVWAVRWPAELVHAGRLRTAVAPDWVGPNEA